MGEREEDEGTADVEDIVGGQTHHQEVEVPLASPAAEHQDADGVADEADAEHYQLKKYHYYLPSHFIQSELTCITPSTQNPNMSPTYPLSSCSSSKMSACSSSFVETFT